MMNEARFLITYDAFGNDLYLPISQIKYIQTGYSHNKYFLHIAVLNEEDGYEERYDNQDAALSRLNQIKDIIGAQ